MFGFEARRGRAARAALVLVQVFLLLFSSVGSTVVLAADPTPSDAPAAESPTPDPSPTEEPAAEPSPTEAPAPDPTTAPDPTAAPDPTPAPTDAPAASPTIASDKDDYAPGELVTLTGAGWAPGENVHIYVNDHVGSTWSRNVDVTADATAAIHDQFNLPNWFVASYTVVASGEHSGIVVSSFTDSSPASASLTILASGCAAAPVTIATGDTICVRATVVVSSTGNQPYRTQWFAPGAGSPTFEDSHSLGAAGTVTFDDSHAVNTAGTWTIRACGSAACNGANLLDTETFVVNGATSLSVAARSGTYFGSTTANLSATLTNSPGGTPISGATVTFTLLGNPAGSAVTNASGVATLAAPTSLGTNAAGSYPTGIGASYAGTAALAASTGTGSLTIAEAPSTTTVTCGAGPFTYSGSVITPCSVTVTGANLSLTPAPTYSNNVNAGTATASYSFDDANHLPSSDSKSFTIGKAGSTTSVTCPASETYTGAAIEPCSATATGVGGLNVGVTPVTYTNNVNVGTANASATYAGDANHEGSSDSETFTIDKAGSTTTINCPTNVTFTGLAIEPCTATVTGAGGLDESVTVTYTDNTNAGTANAFASFAGDANHEGSSDTETFTIDKATSVTVVTCDPGPFVYTGSAFTPCTASVTGVGGLDATLTVSYANNVNAGTATASASFAGDANHEPSSDSENFTIDKAPSTTTVTCDPGPFVYSGDAIEPCTATVTGAGGLDESVTVTYTDNTNAGTANAFASFAGDANHEGSSDTETFTIDKATSVTVVTCDPGPFVYTGSAFTPCTASVTGVGGLDATLTVSYANNVNAGTATASASFAGDANHEPSSDSENFTIDKAPSTTTVTCDPGPFVHSGDAIEPCSVLVTGAGGLSEAFTPLYTNNINAGTATASFSYPGDANHEPSSDSETFTIDKATSMTTVTCPANVTFTGSPITPCSAVATGAGSLNQVLTIGYTNNTNAGTATASASFAGDANHEGSSDSENFTIDKAPSTTTVTCPASIVFTGLPLTPCTATVTGAGSLNQSLTVSYADNTNVGTATASASYGGDANHLTSDDSKTFAISKATSSVTLTCPVEVVYTGVAQTPCTASVTGAGGLNQSLTVTYSNNILGTATASATFVGDANHTSSSASTTFRITFVWAGFLQPINDTAHQTGLNQSKFKTGQTIPAKFVLRNAAGLVVQQTGSPTFSRTNNLGSCDNTAAPDTVPDVTPDSGSIYKWDGTQYHFNWSTKGLQSGEYRIYANLADGTRPYVDICLTK